MFNFNNNQESANWNHSKRSSGWETLKNITIPNTGEDSEQRSSDTAVNYYNFENKLVIPGKRDIYPMAINSGDLASRNSRLYTRKYP